MVFLFLLPPEQETYMLWVWSLGTYSSQSDVNPDNFV